MEPRNLNCYTLGRSTEDQGETMRRCKTLLEFRSSTAPPLNKAAALLLGTGRPGSKSPVIIDANPNRRQHLVKYSFDGGYWHFLTRFFIGIPVASTWLADQRSAGLFYRTRGTIVRRKHPYDYDKEYINRKTTEHRLVVEDVRTLMYGYWEKHQVDLTMQ